MIKLYLRTFAGIGEKFPRQVAKNAKIMTENEVAKILVDIFLKVHKTFGQDFLNPFMKQLFVMN